MGCYCSDNVFNAAHIALTLRLSGYKNGAVRAFRLARQGLATSTSTV